MEQKTTQMLFIKKTLEERKEVSRNFALRNYISRLSAIIYTLRHSFRMNIEGMHQGGDYIYYLKN